MVCGYAHLRLIMNELHIHNSEGGINCYANKNSDKTNTNNVVEETGLLCVLILVV